MEKEDLEALLTRAVADGATRLHLATGLRPSLRVNGRLVRVEQDPLSEEDVEFLCKEYLFADHHEKLAKGLDVEFLYCSNDGMRFRTVVTRQSRGMSMAFHRIPTTIPEFTELSLPRLMAGVCSLNSGLIAVTGFLGSGKSTTLAAIVDHINRMYTKHIVLIESPIEFIHQSATSVLHQREVGFHVNSYADGVREACRSGAEVIVVGEVKDGETLDAILEAAERGVLVFTAVQGSSTVGALNELQSLCREDSRGRMRARLAMSLRVMVAQTLIQKADGDGKVPLVEVLVNGSVIARLIRTGKLNAISEAIVSSRGLGAQTFDMGLRELLEQKMITEEEAAFHAADRDVVFGKSRGRSPLRTVPKPEL